MIKKYTEVEETKQITIEELIGSEGRYVGPTVGVSMLPMLKTGRDSVVIVKKEARLRPLDVALYKRGDNCYSDEKIPESAVFGVLKEYFRKNRHIDCATDEKYLRYAKRRVKNYRLRRFFVLPYLRCRNFASRLYHKIFKRKNGESE